eukprot:8254839-Pyramimonas_sp.AAC.1
MPRQAGPEALQRWVAGPVRRLKHGHGLPQELNHLGQLLELVAVQNYRQALGERLDCRLELERAFGGEECPQGPFALRVARALQHLSQADAEELRLLHLDVWRPCRLQCCRGDACQPPLVVLRGLHVELVARPLQVVRDAQLHGGRQRRLSHLHIVHPRELVTLSAVRRGDIHKSNDQAH